MNVTKCYVSYTGNSPKGEDSGDKFARFADYYATEKGYQIKRKVGHQDNFTREVWITASQKQWKVIEKDYQGSYYN